MITCWFWLNCVIIAMLLSAVRLMSAQRTPATQRTAVGFHGVEGGSWRIVVVIGFKLVYIELLLERRGCYLDGRSTGWTLDINVHF